VIAAAAIVAGLILAALLGGIGDWCRLGFCLDQLGRGGRWWCGGCSGRLGRWLVVVAGAVLAHRGHAVSLHGRTHRSSKMSSSKFSSAMMGRGYQWRKLLRAA
jgi:hypothetical protein